jgi:feruloyl-CoA synthase
MRSRYDLKLRGRTLPDYLRRQSEDRPDSVWIAQRNEDRSGWRTVTYRDARKTVDSLAQALIDLKLPVGTSLAILSENSIEHALITYAAFQVGLPIAPITAAYALQTGAENKLKERLGVVQPSLVFVQSGKRYAKALEAVEGPTRVIVVDHPRPGKDDLLFADLSATVPGEGVDRALSNVNPEAPARYMFTSGSSGAPKAVIQSQKNIIVAVESNLTSFGQTGGNGVRRLDWMPWSHVTGAAVLAATLFSGGTFYIDDGKPTQEEFGKTLSNLRDVSPTNYFSMPIGYVMLADALESDSELAEAFFKNLLTMGYGGARLPDDVARRLQKLAVQYTGYKVPITCGYGSTETGPGGALVYWPTDRVGMIGLPHPGYELKLVPLDEDRFEVRVRSDAVASGYLGMDMSASPMLDEDGYYAMGDAASFVSIDDPLQGLVFAGRISEEFKLATGTFVRSGEINDQLMSAAPILQHVLVCGENQQFVTALGWLDVAAARSLTHRSDASVAELNRDPQIHRHIANAVERYNAKNPGSSRSVERISLQDSAPSSEAGELADKGSLRAAAVRRTRAAEIDALYASKPPANVVVVVRH